MRFGSASPAACPAAKASLTTLKDVAGYGARASPPAENRSARRPGKAVAVDIPMVAAPYLPIWSALTA
jgi:hypothetical protein